MIASMETNSTGEGSTEPSGLNSFCIREYVAEVRKRDWKKCCPFNLSAHSEADQVLASLLLEADNDNALVNSIPEDTETLNIFTASQVGNAEVHEARSETPTETLGFADKIIGDDAADTLSGETSAAAARSANDAQCQNETNITEDATAGKNDKPQDSVINYNAAKITNTPSDSAASKVNDAICQNEKSFANDEQQDTVLGNDIAAEVNEQQDTVLGNDIAAEVDEQQDTVLGNDIAAEVDEQQDTVLGNDAVNTFSDGSPEFSNKVKNAARSQNENSISDEDVVALENDKPQDDCLNDDGANAMNVGPSEPSGLEARDAQCQNDKRRRNLAQKKPQKFRRLSDIYKELGSCVGGSEGNVDSEFTAETSEDDSDDEVTLGTFIRRKKYVRANSKRSDALKNKRKAPQVAEPRFDKAKRSKSVSDDNRGNDSDLGSKYHLRKRRINVPDLQMTNKLKKFSPEVRHSSSQIMHENKDSLLSRGHKSNKESVQEDCAREVLKLLDGNQSRFEENHSRLSNAGVNTKTSSKTATEDPTSSHGVKSAEHLVQPPTTIIPVNNVEKASGCVHKRIGESSPPTDNESMAVLQLLRLSNAGVNTKTSSKTATEDPTLPVAKLKSPCGLDVAPPASGSMVSKPHVKITVIKVTDVSHAEQAKSGTFTCRVNRNPAEFSIPDAKKFMRRGKAVKTV